MNERTGDVLAHYEVVKHMGTFGATGEKTARTPNIADCRFRPPSLNTDSIA